MKKVQKISDEKMTNDHISVKVNKKLEATHHSSELLQKKNIVLNTSVQITVELGKTKMKIKDFLNLTTGSVLILDKSIQEPLNIFVNDFLIASGEIVFLDKQYGLRITHIINSLKPINSTV